jgi:hypothetical protein
MPTKCPGHPAWAMPQPIIRERPAPKQSTRPVYSTQRCLCLPGTPPQVIASTWDFSLQAPGAFVIVTCEHISPSPHWACSALKVGMALPQFCAQNVTLNLFSHSKIFQMDKCPSSLFFFQVTELWLVWPKEVWEQVIWVSIRMPFWSPPQAFPSLHL